MKDIIESFGPPALTMLAVFVLLILPLYWLAGYAKKERKDHRIVVVVGLLTTWLVGLLILLILPKLSDEEFAKINPPKQVAKRRDGEGMSEVGIIFCGLGVCLPMAGIFAVWLAFGV